MAGRANGGGVADEVRPTHPHIHPGRVIRSDATRTQPPSSSRVNQMITRDLDLCRNLPPWFVPNAKEPATLPELRESGVTLEQKFVGRSRRADPGIIRFESGAKMERACTRFYFSPLLMLVIAVAIHLGKSIGQSEAAGTQPSCQPARKPFLHEINSRLRFMCDVGANVEKMMSGDWFEEERA